jgi:hypothetical protein
MSDLVKECYDVIKKQIAPALHEEAKEIIDLTTDKHRQDFITYHHQDQGNICCLVLDAAKQDLIKEGKLELKEDSAFGNPLLFE